MVACDDNGNNEFFSVSPSVRLSVRLPARPPARLSVCLKPACTVCKRGSTIETDDSCRLEFIEIVPLTRDTDLIFLTRLNPTHK